MTTEQDTDELLVDADEILGAVATEFLAPAVALVDSSTVRGVLLRVVEAARVVVPGADLVSVTLRTSGGFHTPSRPMRSPPGSTRSSTTSTTVRAWTPPAGPASV